MEYRFISIMQNFSNKVKLMMPVKFLKSCRSRRMKKFRPIFMFHSTSDIIYKISGVTRDAAGNAVGNCIVDLFYTRDDVKAATVQSDDSGNFTFLIGPNLQCYAVAYLAGSPDVFGTTINTLVGQSA